YRPTRHSKRQCPAGLSTRELDPHVRSAVLPLAGDQVPARIVHGHGKRLEPKLGTFGQSGFDECVSLREVETVHADQFHFTSGGRLIRIASMLPPVLRPNNVPRS